MVAAATAATTTAVRLETPPVAMRAPRRDPVAADLCDLRLFPELVLEGATPSPATRFSITAGCTFAWPRRAPACSRRDCRGRRAVWRARAPPRTSLARAPRPA